MGGLHALRETGGSSGRDCVAAPVTRAQPTADGIRFGFTGREGPWVPSQRQFKRFVTWAKVRGSGGAASSDFRMRP